MFPATITLPKGHTVLIRKASHSDAAGILEHVDQVGGETDYLTYGSGGSGMTVADQKKLIDRSKAAGNWLILIAEMDGEVAGLLNFRSGRQPRTAHSGIFGLTVIKQFWNLGIGRALVSSLMKWAVSADITKINLKVRSDNTRALTLYRQMGFIEEGRISREYRMDGKYYDNILMGLEIDD